MEDANLVARDGQVDLVPALFGVAGPGDEHALFRQRARAVLEAAEFRDAAGAGQLALVVVLLGEGQQEALLALGPLQRHHGLLDVVVVALELLVQPGGFLVEGGKRRAHAVDLARPLHAPAVLGADVDRDRVEQVLVVVVPGHAPGRFELDEVLERGPLELGVGEAGEVGEGGGGGVDGGVVAVCPAPPAAVAGNEELFAQQRRPLFFVFGRDGPDHDLHQIRAGLDADDVQDAAFRLHEKSFQGGFGV